MKKTKTPPATALSTIDQERAQQRLDALVTEIGSHFPRADTARTAGAFVLALMSDLETKNCWTLAEHCGHATPDRLQYFLSRAAWDCEALLGQARDLVVDHFGAPDAILVVDETGDLKKGTKTVGVQRQYTGTAGRIENSQVAVYLTYASNTGHALIDRRLYLPKSWTADPTRCAEAGVPGTVEFATKPVLAAAMITNALDADVPAAWVAGDEVYGANPILRDTLHDRQIGYVLGIACNTQITVDGHLRRLDDLAADLPDDRWQRLSAGTGTKGTRWYSWTEIAIPDAAPVGGHCSVLIRRNDRTGEHAYYRCFCPHAHTLADLVRVAGKRWTVEESFQTSKGVAGLDQHQVRTWRSWHRWTGLVILALAFLATATAAERADHHDPSLIRLSINEFRRLFIALILRPLQHHANIESWSTWRRRHQKRAQNAHQNRRSKPQ